jgi:hypothetical protein
MSFCPYFLQLRPSSRGVTSWTVLTLTWVLLLGSVFLRFFTGIASEPWARRSYCYN